MTWRVANWAVVSHNEGMNSCPYCHSSIFVKRGHNRSGSQRFLCRDCIVVDDLLDDGIRQRGFQSQVDQELLHAPQVHGRLELVSMIQPVPIIDNGTAGVAFAFALTA